MIEHIGRMQRNRLSKLLKMCSPRGLRKWARLLKGIFGRLSPRSFEVLFRIDTIMQWLRNSYWIRNQEPNVIWF
jgi:hypothetical protein